MQDSTLLETSRTNIRARVNPNKDVCTCSVVPGASALDFD